MKVYFLLFCGVVLTLKNETKRPVYQVGLLIPKENFSTTFGFDTSYGATILAIEDLENQSIIPKNSLKVIWVDTKADPVIGVGKAVMLKNVYNIDAIIGAPHSSVNLAVSYLTAYWNLPHLSWGSTDSIFEDKKVFKTLIRTTSPFSKIGMFLSKFLKIFNWNVAAIYGLLFGKYFNAAINGVVNNFEEYNITISENISFNSSQLNNKRIRQHLMKLKREARIIIVSAPKPTLRLIMVNAYNEGMCNGDFVFIALYSFPEAFSLNTEDDKTPLWYGNDSYDRTAKEAFKVLFGVTLSSAKTEVFNKFREQVIKKQKEKLNMTFSLNKTGSRYSPYLYDAIYLYGILVNKTVAMNQDIKNGTLLYNLAKTVSFTSGGVLSLAQFDDNADRMPLYWVWSYASLTGIAKVVAKEIFLVNNKTLPETRIKFLSKIKWLTSDGKPPLDVPLCGFNGEKCITDDTGKIAGSVSGSIIFAFLLFAGLFYGIKKKIFEDEITRLSWKVNYSDITVLTKPLGSQDSSKTVGSDSVGSSISSNLQQTTNLSNLGQYLGIIVYLKIATRTHITLSRYDMLEMKMMRDISHENINNFIGASVEPPNLCILFCYCNKGSLKAMLDKPEFKMDTMFVMSFVWDIINGMSHLHDSFLKSHGHLKSTNCVIDHRWVLKITDYGPTIFRQNDDIEPNEDYQGLLWTAPEVLRQLDPPVRGTQQGDVYSFAIILHEICFRQGTFPVPTMNDRDIIGRVRNGESIPFRPQMDVYNTEVDPDHVLKNLMEICWAEDPNQRPEFSAIKSYLKTHSKDICSNLMDTVLKKMDWYTANLETMVKERTQALEEEKKKTENLLYQLLPSSIAEKLKAKEKIAPEEYESVTIFFSDIVGFTQLSALSTPLEVVNLLNDLYTVFDDIISKHDVYKVEIIGDAYMVVSGLPHRNENRHSSEIADMSLFVISSMLVFKVAHMPKQQLQVRIGLHTGPCCAGIVGIRMPRYCLFGDTVNTASRMESTGRGMRIHITESTRNSLLANSKDYLISSRGEIMIKGKGLMSTFWLNGKRGFAQKLPNVSDFSDDSETNAYTTDMQKSQETQQPPKEGSDIPGYINHTEGVKDSAIEQDE